jgi:hypothetical protein
MATTHPAPRPAPVRPKPERLPAWAVVILLALLTILVYGLARPKPPSAFDRPEAQVNQPGVPWNAPHAF